MHELVLTASIASVALFGCVVGFFAGLVPGLHANNIAVLMTSYAGASLALFGAFSLAVGGASASLLASCFVCSALVGHLFSEGIVSAYVGVPAGDTVSVLPAHRLARAGLGRLAVQANSEGCLAGVFIGVLALGPICLLFGPPLGVYGWVRPSMGAMIIAFSAFLVLSEGRNRRQGQSSVKRVAVAACLFIVSGLLGMIVLQSDYYACRLPSMPWEADPWTKKSSLLLPLFAGLFGIPNLLLSIGCSPPFDVRGRGAGVGCGHLGAFSAAVTVAGGILVGWIPGMTSGSTASLLCRDGGEGGSDVEGSSSFIWRYSAISAAGAVLSVGALFVILRARSGVMDAVLLFLGPSEVSGGWAVRSLPMLALLFSMVLSAVVAHVLTPLVDQRLADTRRTLSSERVSLIVLAFLVSLVCALTGLRGLLVMACAVFLGLLPPRLGLRRIDLMGCLLVPIAYTFVSA